MLLSAKVLLNISRNREPVTMNSIMEAPAALLTFYIFLIEEHLSL